MARASMSNSEYVSLFRPEMDHYVMRCNHTAVFLEPMIYVFGGSDGITAFNTLGAFNLDTRARVEIPLRRVLVLAPSTLLASCAGIIKTTSTYTEESMAQDILATSGDVT